MVSHPVLYCFDQSKSQYCLAETCPGPQKVSVSEQYRCFQGHKFHERKYDNIYLRDRIDSIGTIIKMNAVNIHRKLLRRLKLTCCQRKIMTNGLSSALDMSTNSFVSQSTLFTPKDLTAKVKYVIVIVSNTSRLMIATTSSLGRVGVEGVAGLVFRVDQIFLNLRYTAVKRKMSDFHSVVFKINNCMLPKALSRYHMDAENE
ncbi:hypothetical protein BDF21DRAFT_397006 [Thamnidium elegans]|nr:hypothetical protein BDF21DRAFT_397006 [Thamnidium elegans]